MRLRALILMCLLLGFCEPLRAQQETGRWNVSAFVGAGYMAHGPGQYQALARTFSYPTADLRIGHQLVSDDPASYEVLYNYPNVGLGINWKGASHMGWVGQSRLDDLFAIYGFFERNCIRTRKFSLGYDFSLGLAFNTSVYNAKTNPANVLFNSGVTFYLGPSMHVRFQPTRHMEFGLMGRFTHYSTGRMVYPNAGFNGIDLMATARYSLEEPRYREGKAPRDDSFKKHMLYELYAGTGIHRCSLIFDTMGECDPWPCYTYGANACYQYTKSLSSGVGVDVFAFTDSFIRTVAECEQKSYPTEDTASYEYHPVCFGLSAIQQVHYKNFTAWVQVGAYLYKHLGLHEQEGITYQRFGGKITFPKLANMYLGVGCRCHHFSRAACLDFMLGIRL